MAGLWHTNSMTGKQLLKLMRQMGCIKLSQKGSHLKMSCGRCGTCRTVVPMHAGEDLGKGLLNQIEKDMAKCLGKRWVK